MTMESTLAVGSSHGDFGFNPAYVPDSFIGDFDHLLPEAPGCAILSTRIRNCLA